MSSELRDHRANRLLGALEAEELAFLEPHLEVVDLSAGTVLYEAGQSVGYAYFPHHCVVSLLAVLKDGGSAEVAVFGREGVLGFASSLVSRESFGRYIVHVPGTASRVPVEQLMEAVDRSPKLQDLLRRFVEALLAQTFQTVACNAVHPVEARCCRWLLSAHDRDGDGPLRVTHEVLAALLGVQRSSVTIVMGTLQTAGFIKQARGVITVVDRVALEDAACECYGSIRRSFERLLPNTYSDG